MLKQCERRSQYENALQHGWSGRLDLKPRPTRAGKTVRSIARSRTARSACGFVLSEHPPVGLSPSPSRRRPLTSQPVLAPPVKGRAAMSASGPGEANP